MKTRIIFISALVVLTLAVSAGTAFACPVCGAPNNVTISGPSLNGTVKITDAKITGQLGMDQFFGWRDQYRTPIDPPANLSG